MHKEFKIFDEIWASLLHTPGISSSDSGFPQQYKSELVALHDAWNACVVERVPKARLLVQDHKKGWATLCAFLGKPFPASAHPHVNSSIRCRIPVIHTQPGACLDGVMRRRACSAGCGSQVPPRPGDRARQRQGCVTACPCAFAAATAVIIRARGQRCQAGACADSSILASCVSTPLCTLCACSARRLSGGDGARIEVSVCSWLRLTTRPQRRRKRKRRKRRRRVFY